MGLGITYHGYGNGFPFPIEHVTGASEAAAGVGAGTLYPVGMKLPHAAEMFWRWDEFQLRIAGDNGVDGYQDATETYARPTPSFGSPESVLCYQPAVGVGDTINIGDSPDEWYFITIEAGQWGMFFEEDMFSGTAPEARIRYYDGSYYPKIQYEASISTLAYQASTYQVWSTDDFTGKIIMQDGTEYNLPMSIDDGGATATPDAWELSCKKYFSYGGKYNTTTGDPI